MFKKYLSKSHFTKTPDSGPSVPEHHNDVSTSQKNDCPARKAGLWRLGLSSNAWDNNPHESSGPHSTEGSHYGDSVNHGSDAGSENVALIPDSKQQYRTLKQDIEKQWMHMLDKMTLTQSYDLTLKYKELRNRKSDFRENPQVYIEELETFKKKMLPQDSSNAEVTGETFEKPTVLKFLKYKSDYYPKILSKLKKLESHELENSGETKADLIDIYTIIMKKLNKTISKLTADAAASSLAAGVTCGISLALTEKKGKNLHRSANFYHNWLKNLDRKIDTFQAKNK